MRNEDVKYYVNEDKRTVVAVIDGCNWDAYNEVEKIVENYGVHVSDYNKVVYMPRTFKGIAKCHPEDKWDEEVGKKVARHKLLVAYNEAKFNAIRGYYRNLLSAVYGVKKKYFND